MARKKKRLVLSASLMEDLEGWLGSSFSPWHEASELAEDLLDYLKREAEIIPDALLPEQEQAPPESS